MNNTKIAVIFSEKKPYSHLVENLPSITSALINFFTPKNFHIEFFFYSDTMQAIEKGRYTVWFKNTIKALEYGVNVYFEPDIVFCVGSPNFDWNRFTKGGRLSFLYWNTYDEPNDPNIKNFDKVFTITDEDSLKYKISETINFFDHTTFYKTKQPQIFDRVYPQKIQNTELFNDLNNTDRTVVFGENKENKDYFYIKKQNKSVLNDIFNSAKVTCLMEQEDDIELALSSLACGVPVVTTKDLKSSKLPYVFVSNATTPDYELAIQQALELGKQDYNLQKYFPLTDGWKWFREFRKVHKKTDKKLEKLADFNLRV